MRARLPTLLEVLERRTGAPIDLLSFYHALDDLWEQHALAFWIDVARHEQHCAAHLLSGPASAHGESPAAAGDGPTLQDMESSARYIYERYLVRESQSEHALCLPDSVAVDTSWMKMASPVALFNAFDAPKRFVYAQLERSAYPAFLQHQVFRNIRPSTALARLSVGLLVLWVALTFGLSCVFLDTVRATRVWIVLPLGVSGYLLVSWLYQLDPVLALIGCTETRPLAYARITEPYVGYLQRQQAAGLLVCGVMGAAACAVLFIFVPGHRL
ncbi:Bud site selection protein, Revert to axial protein 1 [Malassezia sp. CBS 17886]|nr:Bud site selection protein, Revert to axial protein 1 [Malassezia sp. CBS 17886]